MSRRKTGQIHANKTITEMMYCIERNKNAVVCNKEKKKGKKEKEFISIV